MTVRERTDRHESTRRLQAEAVRLRLVEDSPEAEATVDKASFFAIMGAFPTGVTVVTALDDNGEPRGLTSNAISSRTKSPISRSARTLRKAGQRLPAPASRYQARATSPSSARI